MSRGVWSGCIGEDGEPELDDAADVPTSSVRRILHRVARAFTPRPPHVGTAPVSDDDVELPHTD